MGCLPLDSYSGQKPVHQAVLHVACGGFLLLSLSQAAPESSSSGLLPPLQLLFCNRHHLADSSSFESQLLSKFHPNLVLLSFGLKAFNDRIAHEVQMTSQWVRGPAWTVHGLHLGVSLATMNCMQFCKLWQHLCAFGSFSYTSPVLPLVHWLGRCLHLSRLN